jgi:hypothetical protein
MCSLSGRLPACGVRAAIGRIGYRPVFIAADAALLVVGGALLLLDSRPAAS